MSTTEMFGPSALATPANALSMARLLLAPALVVAILDTGRSWTAALMWIALATTDSVDGYLARWHGSTRSGAFLDPLADKVLVLGAMWALVAEDIFHALPVAIISVREVAMSVYRSVVAQKGVSVPARPSAKAKTAMQSIAVAAALLPPPADRADWFGSTLLWVAVVLALFSFYEYLRDGRRMSRAV